MGRRISLFKPIGAWKPYKARPKTIRSKVLLKIPIMTIVLDPLIFEEFDELVPRIDSAIRNELKGLARLMKDGLTASNRAVPKANEPYKVYMFRSKSEHHQKTKKRRAESKRRRTRGLTPKEVHPSLSGLRLWLQELRIRKHMMKGSWLNQRRLKRSTEKIRQGKGLSIRTMLGLKPQKRKVSRQRFSLNIWDMIAPINKRAIGLKRKSKKLQRKRSKLKPHGRIGEQQPGRLRRASKAGFTWEGSLYRNRIIIKWGITDQDFGKTKFYNYAPVVEGMEMIHKGGGKSPYAREVRKLIYKEVKILLDDINSQFISQIENLDIQPIIYEKVRTRQ